MFGRLAGGLPPAFWCVWLGTIVNRLGGFVVPFLALYLTMERGLSVTRAGVVLSLYGAGATIGGLVGGVLADRFGRRPALILSLSLGAAAMYSLGFVTRPAFIAPLACLTGFAYELYRPVVASVVADVVPALERTRAYGLLYWAINFGAAVAPVLAGMLVGRGYSWVFALDAATTLAYALIVAALLPETQPALGRASSSSEESLLAVARDRVFLRFLVLTCLVTGVMFQAFVAMPVDLAAHGVTPARYGWVIGLNGALIVLVQPFAAPFIARLGRSRALASGAALMGVGFGMNAWTTTLAGYAAAVVVWTLGEILFMPLVSATAADLAPIALRGRYQGASAMAFGFAAFAGQAAGAAVLQHFGPATLWTGCLVVGLFAAAMFAVDRFERAPSAGGAS